VNSGVGLASRPAAYHYIGSLYFRTADGFERSIAKQGKFLRVGIPDSIGCNSDSTTEGNCRLSRLVQFPAVFVGLLKFMIGNGCPNNDVDAICWTP